MNFWNTWRAVKIGAFTGLLLWPLNVFFHYDELVRDFGWLMYYYETGNGWGIADIVVWLVGALIGWCSGLVIPIALVCSVRNSFVRFRGRRRAVVRT